MKSLVYRAAYHTPAAVHQNIAGSAEDGTGHAEGKLDLSARGYLCIELEQDAAGGDVVGDGADIAIGSGEHYRQRKGKADRTTDLLTLCKGRRLLGGDRRSGAFCLIHGDHPESPDRR